MLIHRVCFALVAALLASILLSSTSRAQATPSPVTGTAKAAADPEWAEVFGDASLAVIWQSAWAASERITAALVDRKLAGIASLAETVHVAAHALVDQVKLDDSERNKRLHGALNQTARIADDVITHANHDKPDETAAAHRRLKSALALVKLRLPAAIIEAPPQTLRFVKSANTASDQKSKIGSEK